MFVDWTDSGIDLGIGRAGGTRRRQLIFNFFFGGKVFIISCAAAGSFNFQVGCGYCVR